MNSPELLSASETCLRKAFYRRFKKAKFSTVETLRLALSRALVAEERKPDTVGDVAGQNVFDIASEPGIDTDASDKYACAMNLACLADLVATTIRKPEEEPWRVPEVFQDWNPGCLMSSKGDTLRRLVLVSHWNDERHYSECRNWYTLGEMAAYDLPMQLVVVIIGPERNGRRHSHWTKCLRHTIGKTNIRFKRRVGNTSGGFKDSWTEIWREDHDEISRETWLNGMLKDDVLHQMCFKVDMPALTKDQRKMIRDLAARKMDQIEKLTKKPLLQLSGCDWPVKCQFINCCHAIPEREPSRSLGFVEIDLHTSSPQADMSKGSEKPSDPCLLVPESVQPPPV